MLFVSINISNAQATEDTIQVVTGWNIIGSLATGKTSDIIESEPTGIIVSPFYGYGAGYYQADTLKRGKGYWVKVNQNGLLYFMISPTVTTTAITSVTSNSASGGGNVTSQGSSSVTARGVCWSTSQNPTTADSKTDVGSGTGSFTSSITGLSGSTTYYVRAYATNSAGTSYGGQVSFTTSGTTGTPCPGTPTVTYEGKTYNTVQIGTQCWLKENLDVGTRIDGSQNQTNNSTIEKYCYNNDPNNCNTYGGLYQWNEAMQYSTTEGARGICPSGWHIPTYVEFQTLSTAVGGDGNALKAIGQGTGAGAGTNTSGFSALLAGNRNYNGYFYNLGNHTDFWSSTEDNASNAATMYLYYDGSIIFYGDTTFKEYGFSVRCVKD